MGIESDIRQQIKDDYERRLGSETEKILLSESEMTERLHGGTDAPELCIEKWNKLHDVFKKISDEIFPHMYYGHIREYIGYQTCALCLEAYEKFQAEYGRVRYRDDKCGLCRLASIERCFDEGAVYCRIDNGLSFRIKDASHNDEDFFSRLHSELDADITQMIVILKRLA